MVEIVVKSMCWLLGGGWVGVGVVGRMHICCVSGATGVMNLWPLLVPGSVQEYALEHVMLGDEAAARAALQQKAAVADALRQATRRAETNSALARWGPARACNAQLQQLCLL